MTNQKVRSFSFETLSLDVLREMLAAVQNQDTAFTKSLAAAIERREA